jgi:hypothetical protein
MKKSSEGVQGGPQAEFKDYILGVLPQLGLTPSSLDVSKPQHVKVTARSSDKNVPNTVLFEASGHKRRVGKQAIEAITASIDTKNAQGAVYFSMAGFTPEAMSYAMEHNVMLFSPEDINRLKEKTTAPVSGEIKTFERVFSSSMSPPDAFERFKEKGRKPLLGLIGGCETVDAVVGRYSPIGCFKLKRGPGFRNTAGTNGEAIGENTFFVNLNTCALYFLYRGISGKGSKLRSTNILRRMMDMDVNTIRLLSWIIEQEEFLLDRLSPEQQTLMEHNVNGLIILQNLGLIMPRRDGRGYMSNINLPKFSDAKYDLSRFWFTEQSVQSEFGVDDIEYPPEPILQKLKELFGAEGEFEGVIYMPYYSCRYSMPDGRVRFDTMENLRQKNG